MKKASSPPKTADLVPTPTTISGNASGTTRKVAKLSLRGGKGKATAPKEKKKGEKQEKSREEQASILSIETDVDSEAGLLID